MTKNTLFQMFMIIVIYIWVLNIISRNFLEPRLISVCEKYIRCFLEGI